VKTGDPTSSILDPGPLVVLRLISTDITTRWGQPWQFGTAAYWVAQARRVGRCDGRDFALGDSLVEELAARLLGGHGMPAAMGLAAFRAVRDAGLLVGETPGADAIESILTRPLKVGPRQVRYRFPHQRARWLSLAIKYVRAGEPPSSCRELRDWLLSAAGIGPKTASWIARNWTGGDTVAVIDIHVRRAGMAAGIFHPAWRLPKHYLLHEEAFLAWAEQGSVSPCSLDASIWSEMATVRDPGLLRHPAFEKHRQNERAGAPG
jgi:hypothetical protein